MADKPLRLSSRAIDDLDRIWDYSAATWGEAQADHYNSGLERSLQTIASMPGIGRMYPEFDPPVRILASAEHLIIYVDLEEEVQVIRVIASRRDWRDALTK